MISADCYQLGILNLKCFILNKTKKKRFDLKKDVSS